MKWPAGNRALALEFTLSQPFPVTHTSLTSSVPEEQQGWSEPGVFVLSSQLTCRGQSGPDWGWVAEEPSPPA